MPGGQEDDADGQQADTGSGDEFADGVALRDDGSPEDKTEERKPGDEAGRSEKISEEKERAGDGAAVAARPKPQKLVGDQKEYDREQVDPVEHDEARVFADEDAVEHPEEIADGGHEEREVSLTLPAFGANARDCRGERVGENREDGQKKDGHGNLGRIAEIVIFKSQKDHQAGRHDRRDGKDADDAGGGFFEGHFHGGLLLMQLRKL